MKNKEDVVLKIKNILIQDIGRFKHPENNEYDLVINDYIKSFKKDIEKSYNLGQVLDNVILFNLSRIEFNNKIAKTISADDVFIANKLNKVVHESNKKLLSLINTNYETLQSNIHWEDESEQISLGIFLQEKINFSNIDNIIKDNPLFMIEALFYEYFKQSIYLKNKEVDTLPNVGHIYSGFISEEIKDNIYVNLEEYFKVLFKTPNYDEQDENQINGVYLKNNEVFNEITQKIYNLLYGNMRESLRKGLTHSEFNQILELDMCKIEELINPYFNVNQKLNTTTFENLIKTRYIKKNNQWEISFDKSRLFYYSNFKNNAVGTILSDLETVVNQNETIFKNKNFSLKLNLKRKESEVIELKFSNLLSNEEQHILKEKIVEAICVLFKKNYPKSYLRDGNTQKGNVMFANDVKTMIREVNLLHEIKNQDDEKIRRKRKI